MSPKAFGDGELETSAAFHLSGLLEAADEIRQLSKLSGDGTASQEDVARTFALLEVEIYDHLVYHITELRKPLAALARSAYSKLIKESTEDEDLIGSFDEMVRRRHEELAGKTRPPTR